MRAARRGAREGCPGKLIRRAEWEFPLGRGDDDRHEAGGAVASIRGKLLAGFERAARGEVKKAPPAREGRPELFYVNELPWRVFVAALAGRQFRFRTEGVAVPMGVTLIRSEVAAFDYTAVLAMIDAMVPAERRAEVFAKFRALEPYALHALKKREGWGGCRKSCR